MSLWGLLTGSNSSEDDSQVTRRTIHDEKNGTWELVSGDEDYQAILGDREHTVLSEEPYDQPRGFWGKLFG